MRKQVTLIVTILMFMMGAMQVPSYVTINPDDSVDALTSGEINGIKYSYGNQSFFASGNITRTANATVTENINRNVTETHTVPLITGSSLSDIYYHLTGVETLPDNTSFPVDQWHNNASYQALLDVIGNQQPLIWDPANATHGTELMNISFIENYRTVESNVISTDGEFLGTYPTNASLIEYNHNYGNGTTSRISFITSAEYVVMLVSYVFEEVVITRSDIQFAVMSSFVRHSVQYNVSANAYQVNVTDGENFGMVVNMFDKIEANYTEVVTSFFGFFFAQVQLYNLSYTNGSYVPINMYPFSLYPTIYSASGSTVEAGFQHVNTEIRSTFQNVVAGFLEKSANATDNQLNASLSLAVWGLQFGNVLVAYDDGNFNDQLDVAFTNNGLETPEDSVRYLGIGEASRTTVVNGYFHQEQFQQNFSSPFRGIDVSETVNDTFTFFDVQQYGFGDPNVNTNADFVWNDPSTNANGDVEFNFGINYTNFPVTWFNTSDGTVDVDNEDLYYGYHLTVNPDTGKANLKTTWIYGGISDAALKTAMDGLSLSMVVKSELFALRAFYSATVDNSTVNSTRASSVGAVVVKSGAGDPATQITVDGPLAKYTSAGGTYDINVTAINLIQVSGSFRGERVSPFSSESSESGGAATTGSLVEKLGIDFHYRVDLIIVSFPQWSGNDINWDPDFGVNYQQKPKATTSEETTSDEQTNTDTVPTDDKTSDQPASSPEASDNVTSGNPLPGFQILTALTMVMVAAVILRRRKV